jgi:hypothetical protein
MEEDRRDQKPWEQDLNKAYGQNRWARGRGPMTSHVLIGLCIVAVGVLLLLDNMGLYQIGNVWRFWPVILIAAGIGRMADSSSQGRIWGGFMVLIGLAFLADMFDFYIGPVRIGFHLVWPLLIIYWGAAMLLRPMWCNSGRSWWSGGAVDSHSSFHYTTIFGGGKRRVETKEFRGGSAVAVFGGYNLDLRDSQIANGDAVVDVNAMFGGVEIRVPESWTVEVKAGSLFGGIDDRTAPARVNAGDKPQRLIVTGFAMFGGISIKN